MASKRGNGEGSIYQRSDNGRWIAVMFVESRSGNGPRGKYISGNTRNDVVRQLKILQRQVDDGEVIHDSSITVEQLLVHWYQDVLKHQVTANTAENYMTIATHHIIPSLGKTKIVKLTTNEVDRLLSKKSATDLSVSTVRGFARSSPRPWIRPCAGAGKTATWPNWPVHYGRQYRLAEEFPQTSRASSAPSAVVEQVLESRTDMTLKLPVTP